MNDLIAGDSEDIQRILGERARRLARPLGQDQAEETLLNMVTFQCGKDRFGVEIAQVREVQPLSSQSWSPVPCTPDFVAGVINLRGRMISILDIARYLGLPPRSIAEQAHVLVVQDGVQDLELALLVDAMPRLVSLPPGQIQPPATTLSPQMQEYLRGVTGDLLMILDLPRLLSDPGIIVNEEV
jgi:purine-binding chemotaxis protein CheW